MQGYLVCIRFPPPHIVPFLINILFTFHNRSLAPLVYRPAGLHGLYGIPALPQVCGFQRLTCGFMDSFIVPPEVRSNSMVEQL